MSAGWYQEARERNLKALELLGEAAGLLRQNAATMTDLGLSRHTHDMVDRYVGLAEAVEDASSGLAGAVELERQEWRRRERGDGEVLQMARAFVCNPDERGGAA